jgi:SAM-dependent methyltransferase
LQCHFGLDTLSWARAGASVAGLDFSGPAVEAATRLAEETGLDARFVQADVYDAVEALDGETFDVVYTGFGALNWLPDLTRWAEVVNALLAEGGFLYLAEFHPFTWVFDEDTEGIAFDYFHDPAGVSFDDDAQGSYADLEVPTRQNRTLEWAHPLSEELRAHADEGTPLVLADPDAPASVAIRQAARGIVAMTPQELPVMQAETPTAPAPPPIGGTELPVVQVQG